jgi:hypothetical protein
VKGVRRVSAITICQPVDSSQPGECFPDWFIRITRPGIDLDAAIEENRAPHEGVELGAAFDGRGRRRNG